MSDYRSPTSSNGMPHRAPSSSDSATVFSNHSGHGGSNYTEQMSSEERAQILSNIRVLYPPAIANNVHIATVRCTDGSTLCMLVVHTDMIKTFWNTVLVAEARPTRAMALTCLLEKTEDKIREMWMEKEGLKDKKNTSPASKAKRGSTQQPPPPPTEKSNIVVDEPEAIDRGIKKSHGMMPWRKTTA